MKNYLIFVLFIGLVFIFTDCIKKDKQSINRAVWSSADPLDIPLKRRQNEFAEGNKVFNSSFESGRFFRDNIDTYEIDGWKEIGESANEVEWVDTINREFNKSDVYEGKRAIRIRNNKTDETEFQGPGILSDYIKVIPGNYRLSFYIKLRNICSNKSRFGNRLMDAINIRVHFYDKNKIEISEEMINPENGKKFDNGFKAFQFSGFWQIDSLDWTKALGISHKFPFFDGDIPDEAKYVRLFLGLKGTGTMWIDNISFEYTQHNFSLAERLNSYKNKEFKNYELILPQPKMVEPDQELRIYNPALISKLPIILIPQKPEKLTLHAAKNLEGKIRQILKKNGYEAQIPVVSNLNPESVSNYSFVFSIGKNALNKQNFESLPYSAIKNHSEGYFIKRIDDASNVISLSGNSPAGDYYATQTFLQLLSDTSLIFHHADVVDYPGYKTRGVFINHKDSSLQNQLENLYHLRYNQLYLDANKTGDFEEFQYFVDKIAKIKQDFLPFTTGISVNPYLSPFKSSQIHTAKISDKNEISRYIKYAYTNKIDNFLLRMDSTVNTEKMCYCNFIFNESNGNHIQYRSLVDVHTDFVNSVLKWTSHHGNVHLMPVWYRNDCIRRSHGRGEAYLEEISNRMPGSVNYLWTGASENPVIIDNIEVERYRKITEREPVLFIKDINPFSGEQEGELQKRYAPGKLRMSSIFEHFELYIPDSFHEKTRLPALITEESHSGFWDIIKLATLANYMWNPDNFNPDVALLKVLTSYLDKEKAFALIEFNELYQGIYEMCIKINVQGKKKKFIRSAEQFIAQMDELLENFDSLIQNPEIQEELKLKKEKAERLYHRTIQK